MLAALAYIIFTVLGLFKLTLIISIILSWLLAFGVVNRSNQFVAMVEQITTALTEPVLRPVRNALPALSGIDLSPLVIFIGITALEILLRNTIFVGLYV